MSTVNSRSMYRNNTIRYQINCWPTRDAKIRSRNEIVVMRALKIALYPPEINNRESERAQKAKWKGSYERRNDAHTCRLERTLTRSVNLGAMAWRQKPMRWNICKLSRAAGSHRRIVLAKLARSDVQVHLRIGVFLETARESNGIQFNASLLPPPPPPADPLAL